MSPLDKYINGALTYYNSSADRSSQYEQAEMEFFWTDNVAEVEVTALHFLVGSNHVHRIRCFFVSDELRFIVKRKQGNYDFQQQFDWRKFIYFDIDGETDRSSGFQS
ncbi:hypothetical protein [Paenibacillus turpanensis]|uniref:hypothetical protein n=1 Tax=Paenibacillus turpanensis TaxID=2689078 RepID=UPI001FB6412E|nr:hypothetical protein [Paenibacillus turpanensis]